MSSSKNAHKWQRRITSYALLCSSQYAHGNRQKLFVTTCPWVYFQIAHEIAPEIIFYDMYCDVISKKPTRWQEKIFYADNCLGVIF